MKITFIGGGNMASALISGLQKNPLPGQAITVSDPNADACARLQEQFSVACTTDTLAAVSNARAIVLAVKPQICPLVLDQLQGHVTDQQCVISIAAGITIGTISGALGPEIPVVRTMPNTPALLGAGITGLYAGSACSDADRSVAENILQAAGATVWVPEEQLLNAVTGVSGSGPAYFFLLTQAMAEAGEKLGLSAETAQRLAAHTAHGAGLMALHGGADVTELRRRVTSPGGTTQAAVETLEAGGFAALVEDAVNAAAERGQQLASAGRKPEDSA